MKLAIGSGPAFRDGLDAARLRWWKKQGVEGIVFYDVWPADFYRTPLDHFRETKKVLDDVGLAVAGFNALRKSLFMPELAEIDQRRTEHCLEVCRVLRPAIFDISVNVPIPHGLDPMAMAARPIFRGAYASAEAYREAAARLKAVARACAELGADLSIELHDDGLQDTADGCLRLIEMIDEPNVGVNPDLGNWARVPYEHLDTWRDQVTKLARRTNYWEVKNYQTTYSPSERRFVSWATLLDEGVIDFRESATILWRAGFRGWVCNEGGVGDYVRSQLRFIEYFRWILDEWIPASAE